MDPNTVTLAIALLSPLVSVIVCVLTIVSTRRQVRAAARRDESDAAESLSNAAAALVKPLTERADKMEGELYAEREARRALQASLAAEHEARQRDRAELTALRGELAGLRSALALVTAERDGLKARVTTLEDKLAELTGGTKDA